jgi:O-antigen ligase
LSIAAILAGWATTQSAGRPVVAVIAVSGFVAGTLFLERNSDRRASQARIVAWIGVLGPLAVAQERTATEVATRPVSSLNLIAAGISVGALVLALALYPPFAKVPLRKREVILIGYLGFAAASVLWSAYPTQTLLKAGQLGVAFALVMVIVRLRPEETLSNLSSVVHLLLLSVIAGLVVAPRTALSTDSLSGVDRLHGVFPYVGADILGLLAVAGLLFLCSNVGRPAVQSLPVRISLATLYVGVLVLAHSRTSLVLLPLGLVVLYAASARWRTRLVIVIPMTALTLAGAFIIAAGPLAHYYNRGQSSAQLQTLTGRTGHWSSAISAWQSHPLAGLGYYSGHRLDSLPSFAERNLSNLDNMWIQTLLDLGAVGVMLLAAFTIAGMTVAWRARRLTALPFALGFVCLASSCLNPSLDQVLYSMVLFAAVLLADYQSGTPRSEADSF